MSTHCKKIRYALKDEEKAVPEYLELRAKALGHPDIQEEYDKIIRDEIEHRETVLRIAKKFGCVCDDK
jgi:rubrerythrin